MNLVVTPDMTAADVVPGFYRVSRKDGGPIHDFDDATELCYFISVFPDNNGEMINEGGTTIYNFTDGDAIDAVLGCARSGLEAYGRAPEDRFTILDVVWTPHI